MNDHQGPSLRFDLPRGNSVEILLKATVSQAEFGTIEQLLSLAKPTFVVADASPLPKRRRPLRKLPLRALPFARGRR